MSRGCQVYAEDSYKKCVLVGIQGQGAFECKIKGAYDSHLPMGQYL